MLALKNAANQNRTTVPMTIIVNFMQSFLRRNSLYIHQIATEPVLDFAIAG